MLITGRLSFVLALGLLLTSAPVKAAETVEILVAAKDLPAGTLLAVDEKQWVAKKVPKGEAPPACVLDATKLTGYRLTRAVRAGEPFNPKDLTKNAGPALPAGLGMVSFTVPASDAAGGFAAPGTKIDLLATVRTGDKIQAFQLLVDVLVVAVSSETDGNKQPTVTISIATTDKQALVLGLAKHRDCRLSVLLRNPDKKADDAYDIDAVAKLLAAPEVAPAPRPAR